MTKVPRALRRAFLAAGLVALVSPSQPLYAVIEIAPDFSADYTFSSLGTPPDVPPSLGGLTFLAGNPNTLLIGGNANSAGGGLYSIGVTRDADNHITGFTGPATLFSTAPNIDGGVDLAPNGTLFVTTYSNNNLLQIKPGSASPDKTIPLSPLGVAGSVGTLRFVPAGFPGAGQLKIASYSGSAWYTAAISPDGLGTYDVGPLSAPITIQGGPEGIVYIDAANAGFTTDSLLVSEYSNGKVVAYDIDSNGDPIPATKRDFITGLSGAEGAVIDPLTGDFLFSTFGGANQVIVVQGFTTPDPPPGGIPEPASLALLGLGSAALLLRRRS